MSCIKVERLGSTERMTFDAFAEFEIQDEDVAVEIAKALLDRSSHVYETGEQEHFVRYTVMDVTALRRQLRAAEVSLRDWQENHGVPEGARGHLEREV